MVPEGTCAGYDNGIMIDSVLPGVYQTGADMVFSAVKKIKGTRLEFLLDVIFFNRDTTIMLPMLFLHIRMM